MKTGYSSNPTTNANTSALGQSSYCATKRRFPRRPKRFIEMGGQDKAGLVQLQLASALQQLPLEDRWPLANALVSQDTFAKDPVFLCLSGTASTRRSPKTATPP